MTPRLMAKMSAQGGVFTRIDALDSGLSSGRIDALVRQRVFRAVRRGVYTTTEHWESLDPWRGRPRLEARAAHLTLRRAHVFSHDSAAHELGLDILRPALPLVHVTKRGFTTAWTEYGIKHHYARFRPDQVVRVNGFDCLDMARTAVDIARERGEVHGTVACDSAMQRSVTRSELEHAYSEMAYYPHVTQARSAVDLADPGAESVGETLTRLLVIEAGIGEPQTQFAVRTSRGVAWCDLRIGRHIVEFDGKVKFLRADQGGVADRPIEDVLWDERTRQTEVCSCGLGMSRVVWEDLWGERRMRTIRRIQQENAVTVAQFGSTLSEEMIAFDRQMRARRVRGA